MINILEINNLTVAYATRRGMLLALNDVCLRIAQGQVLGLAGESGSGKSTIGLAILGLLGEEAVIPNGAILFEGQDLLGLSPQQKQHIRGRKISVVSQDPFSSLNPSLQVGLQVAEPLIFHQGWNEARAVRRAAELLDMVGIPRPNAIVKAYPHELSGGMQQRVLIATALSCDPSLLILDEPTTALDVTIEAQILDLLDELRREKSLSILFISHNLEVLGRLCDEVCILYAGVMLEQGPTEDIFIRPSHPYTKGLLASMPRLTKSVEKHRLSFIPGNLPDMTRLPGGCIFHPRCPFGELKCSRDDQHLLTVAPDHHARCWRLDVLKNEPWPVKDLAPFAATFSEKAMEKGTQPLVQADNLSKEFRLGGLISSLEVDFSGEGPLVAYRPLRLTAVDQVSLDIHSGEVVGLVGESGSGKTTLGRCLVRLLEPSKGHVRLGAQDVTHTPERGLRTLRREAQIIFQNPDSSLNPRKTVRQILARPMKMFGITKGKELVRKVDELLEMVRLTPLFADRYPHQLSGGERQRIGIARAVATSPRFIVCDEAVSALDVSVQSAVLNLLEDLRAEFNLAYLFISHDLSVVAHIADTIAVMYHGLICEKGRVAEVLNPPYHPYTEALLSAVPSFEDRDSVRRIRLKGDPMMSKSLMDGCRFHPRCPRKLGDICELEAPVPVKVSQHHRIICHIPLGELQKIDPVF
jgi:peptide/nickel transport system ATP-binding protein